MILKEGPVLQSQTRTGKKKFWQAAVTRDAMNFYIVKTWWQEGGKKQSSTPTHIFGKNIGKANETSDLEQAFLELDSLYRAQRDDGYSEDGSDDHILTAPMLAHKYKDRSHDIRFPCLIQPKLDGFRMLTDGRKAWTRGGKEHVHECVAHLLFDTGGIVLDGELLLPGSKLLQETSRAAKKFRPGVSDTLEYWVYDLVSPLDFSIRSDMVLSLLDDPRCPPKVRVVPTYKVHSEQALMEAHMEFIAQGHEGTMVRNVLGAYDVGNRSPNLQKLKEFQDSEFEVVDIIDGRGSFEGLAIVVCRTDDGIQFKATPRGTFEYRRELFQNRDQYIGKYLTVRYQYLSEDGCPVGNTVGIDFRDKGDF